MLLVVAALCASAPAANANGQSLSAGARPTDLQLKTLLIRDSIRAYKGRCPCPYSIARDGSECGGRSAWSRPGGANPLCFVSDVTAEMVLAYRRAHGGG